MPSETFQLNFESNAPVFVFMNDGARWPALSIRSRLIFVHLKYYSRSFRSEHLDRVQRNNRARIHHSRITENRTVARALAISGLRFARYVFPDQFHLHLRFGTSAYKHRAIRRHDRRDVCI